MTVGKAMWKLRMIAGLLFGKAVVVTAKSTIEKIQAVENRVWKYLLELGGYIKVESLRGEVGGIHGGHKDHSNNAPICH